MKFKKTLSGIIALALFLGNVFIPKSSDISSAKTKNIAPAGTYYKLTEKTYREIVITKTATGIDYSLSYSELSKPYDQTSGTKAIVEPIKGSAIEISKNTYRQSIGEFSMTFKFSKKKKVRYMKVTQKGTLTSPNDKYKFSATYTHFLDEQNAGGPNLVVKKAKKPGKVTISRITGETEKIRVFWKSLKKNCKGYQIQASLKKSFSGKITQIAEGKASTGIEFSGLTPLKKYYVRIRAYNVNSIGKKTYGKWSKVKTGVAG